MTHNYGSACASEAVQVRPGLWCHWLYRNAFPLCFRVLSKIDEYLPPFVLNITDSDGARLRVDSAERVDIFTIKKHVGVKPRRPPMTNAGPKLL